MKWFVFFFFLPCVSAAQGVKLARYDAFVKKNRIEMEPVSLLSTAAAKLTVTFSAVGTDLFVQCSGAGWGAVTVDDGNELLFRFTNDSTVSVKADGLQTFEPDIPQSTYRHRYRVTLEGVEALARYELAGLRKYSFKEPSDLRIPKDADTKLQKPGAAFLSELKKTGALSPLKRIQAKDVLAHIGDSVQFCSIVYNVHPVATAGEKAIELNLQADYSQPVINLLIADDDRTKFADTPPADFLNKEICVSGVLQLRNKVPTMVVRQKEQLKTKPPAADK